TAGDRGGTPAPDSPSGGKGLFVGDIVGALRDGGIGRPVHSAKALPAEDPDGVRVIAVPERAAPFDVMVTMGAELPAGGAVGTSSLRRRAQLLRSHPDLRIREVRGNVDTRMAKLAAGE